MKEPFKGFWERLRDFVKDIEVSDLPGEEEKEMILHVCEEQSKGDKNRKVDTGTI